MSSPIHRRRRKRGDERSCACVSGGRESHVLDRATALMTRRAAGWRARDGSTAQELRPQQAGGNARKKRGGVAELDGKVIDGLRTDQRASEGPGACDALWARLPCTKSERPGPMSTLSVVGTKHLGQCARCQWNQRRGRCSGEKERKDGTGGVSGSTRVSTGRRGGSGASPVGLRTVERSGTRLANRNARADTGRFSRSDASPCARAGREQHGGEGDVCLVMFISIIFRAVKQGPARPRRTWTGPWRGRSEE
ncbi:hypothetical protein ERJ75_000890000 [Trypanosoma vivax]|nr:hypothetical protein ERJ75_000890000 [Trypanosoma vivax]